MSFPRRITFALQRASSGSLSSHLLVVLLHVPQAVQNDQPHFAATFPGGKRILSSPFSRCMESSCSSSDSMKHLLWCFIRMINDEECNWFSLHQAKSPEVLVTTLDVVVWLLSQKLHIGLPESTSKGRVMSSCQGHRRTSYGATLQLHERPPALLDGWLQEMKRASLNLRRTHTTWAREYQLPPASHKQVPFFVEANSHRFFMFHRSRCITSHIRAHIHMYNRSLCSVQGTAPNLGQGRHLCLDTMLLALQ